MKLIGIFAIVFLAAVKADDKLGKVKIEPAFTEKLVKIGDYLEVQCMVETTDNDEQALKWTTPSKHGYATNAFQSVAGDKTVTKFMKITIESMKKEYLGKYKCEYGNFVASFTLVTPTEDKSSPNFTLNEPTAVLSCDLGGPAASKVIEKVEWLKNDTPISKLDNNKRYTEVPENHTLIIDKPIRADADLYIARFTFKDMDEPYDCEVPYNASPLVLDFEKSKNLIEDDTMELQCKVKGYPHAEVKWYKNDKELTGGKDSNVKLSTLNGYKNASLVIESVTFDDAGDYTCKAQSEYFNKSDSKTLTVRVKDKLAALWPFLGIVGEVIILCTIIFIYEKRRNKQSESDANNVQDVDGSTTDKKEGLRHRNTQSNNPTA